MFAYCASEPFADFEPQGIELPEAVANRIRMTEKGIGRVRLMLDGNVAEVDWDVSESSSRRPIVLTKEFPFWTGRAERVETSEHDDVFYARVDRGRRPIWGRFVRGKRGELVRSQTVILRPVAEEPAPVGWHVVAAYAGDPAPAFPGDPNASHRSLPYWERYALVDGALPYKKGTETATCPW